MVVKRILTLNQNIYVNDGEKDRSLWVPWFDIYTMSWDNMHILKLAAISALERKN